MIKIFNAVPQPAIYFECKAFDFLLEDSFFKYITFLGT